MKEEPMTEPSFACLQCGKTFSFHRHDKIDTGKDPSMKEKVRNGEAFAVTCPSCGWHTHMDYSFLYREEESHTLIYYANTKEIYESAYRYMTGRTGPGWESIRGWIRRVVTSREDLLEKLLILDGGLDDRIIEIMKGLAFVSMKQHQPDAGADTVLFDEGSDGNHYFRFSKEGRVEAAYAFELPMYEKIKNGLAPLLPKLSGEEVVINSQWAAGAMKRIQSL